jgi:hypothetical protein
MMRVDLSTHGRNSAENESLNELANQSAKYRVSKKKGIKRKEAVLTFD